MNTNCYEFTETIPYSQFSHASTKMFPTLWSFLTLLLVIQLFHTKFNLAATFDVGTGAVTIESEKPNELRKNDEHLYDLKFPQFPDHRDVIVDLENWKYKKIEEMYETV